MDERQTSDESIIKLHPVPKTHLFMKKITRIQAIDRQIRKKWIKIKRENQKQNLTTIEEHSINPSKRDQITKHTLVNFEPNRDYTQISNVQNSLRRQKILNNHKRQQQIFYGRRDKSPDLKSPKNQNNPSLTNSKHFLIVDSPRRRIKTQSKPKENIKLNDLPLSTMDRKNLIKYLPNNEQRRPTSLSNQNRNVIKVPFMLEKIKQTKKRQRQAMTCQSEKQLIELSTKNRHHLKEWASQRKGLFQKLKGSRAYYIMKSPTRLSGADDVYIF